MRDYIYAGNMLIEEYKPQVNQHYYYTPDQINSVRMVTNNSGDVVYSAAYSPFGKVHKEWVNAYSPELKFSGKEREGPSGLDYFGARYYGNSQYRFLSVDPAINRDEAIMNPQLWNLYAYCRNNPVSFLDMDGAVEISLTILQTKYDKWSFYSFTRFFPDPKQRSGFLEVLKKDGKYFARLGYHQDIQITLNEKSQEKTEHESQHVEGYEWLYHRNVNELEKAETIGFRSEPECIEFASKTLQRVMSWTPMKWRLHRTPPLSWFTHTKMWAKWSLSKDWE